MKAIFKHELRLYFESMTAYVFGAFLLLFIGIGSMPYNLRSAVSNFEFVLSFAAIVFVVIVPVLTMRCLSEERKQKTDQLLYSLPITTTQVVLGKYGAVLVVFLLPLCFIALYPLMFAQFGDVYLPTAYGSLAAFFLAGGGGVSVFLNRQPGPGRGAGHWGDIAQLLLREPFGVRFFHGGGHGQSLNASTPFRTATAVWAGSSCSRSA